jgi:hypothetical protein
MPELLPMLTAVGLRPLNGKSPVIVQVSVAPHDTDKNLAPSDGVRTNVPVVSVYVKYLIVFNF